MGKHTGGMAADGTLEAIGHLADAYRTAKAVIGWMGSLKVNELAGNCARLKRAAHALDYAMACIDGTLDGDGGDAGSASAAKKAQGRKGAEA